MKKLHEKHFGLNWETSAENLQYYIDFFNLQGLFNHEVNADCNHECEYVEECSELIV